MSSLNIWIEPPGHGERLSGNRREDRRYNLQLDLRWRLIRRRRHLDGGEGRTVDLSSGGILFEANRPMPVGLNVELVVAWPVLLHQVALLELVICGRIVRSDGCRTAIKTVLHEFRDAGAPWGRRAVQGINSVFEVGGAAKPY